MDAGTVLLETALVKLQYTEPCYELPALPYQPSARMRSEGYGSWVCVFGLLSHISPLVRLFVLKTLSRTQRAENICRVFSETSLLQRSSTPAVLRPYV